MLDWMVWTTPVAVFFSVVVLMLVAMTVWELRSPTVPRKGFLPIETTRGDRLFIGLLVAGYINLILLGFGEQLMTWFDLAEEPSAWIGLAVSALVLVWIMRKG
jgi:predicted small integral membrane protein